MPASPVTFLQRIGLWVHIRGGSDFYQAGVHPAHDEDVINTPAGEISQEAWPDPAPDVKGLEREDLPE